MKPDMDLVPTPSQTVGPFFAIELTTDENCVKCVATPQTKGERMWITFRVLDGDGVPVNDAMLEIWQADSSGKYNHPDDMQPKKLDPGWRGFGRVATGEDGFRRVLQEVPDALGNMWPFGWVCGKPLEKRFRWLCGGVGGV